VEDTRSSERADEQAGAKEAGALRLQSERLSVLNDERVAKREASQTSERRVNDGDGTGGRVHGDRGDKSELSRAGASAAGPLQEPPIKGEDLKEWFGALDHEDAIGQKDDSSWTLERRAASLWSTDERGHSTGSLREK
jgi:hypothetical protein